MSTNDPAVHLDVHLEHALEIALDADRAEPERVAHLSRLRDFGSREQPSFAVARALVPLLNEPLDWLSREAFALLAAPHAPDVAVGVDDRGMILSSASALEHLVDDGSGFVRACPDLGPVVAVRHATLLLPRLADEPRWARAGPHGTAWLRRLDRPLLHVLRDGGTLAFTLGRRDDGTLHVDDPHARIEVARVALRTGHVVVAPVADPERGRDACAIDGAPLVRTTELRSSQRLTVDGAPTLEVAALAPVDEIGHAGDDGEVYTPWPRPGETFVEPGGAGHVMHLPFGARGVVSYREPLARVVPPETRATVGALRINEHGALEVVP